MTSGNEAQALAKLIMLYPPLLPDASTSTLDYGTTATGQLPL
jgi:hypothetical protein